jgi:phosphoribosylglycinamide formyltransferase-1
MLSHSDHFSDSAEEVPPGRLRLPVPARIVVLVSGSGTLLQELLDVAEREEYPAKVIAVGADRHGIEGLARAERAGVPGFVVRTRDFADRAAWDHALTEAVAEHQPDLVVSAGFMKILGPGFLSRFPNRVINTHPALLPSFPGAHAVREALEYGVKVTGCTVHLVDGGVDTGPILAQEPVFVCPGDSESELHERIKTVERRLLVDVVAELAVDGCTVDGRKVSIP